MKQLLQHPDSGETRVAEVPAPALRPGFVRVRTAASLVSAGTERTAVEFSRKSLLGKARSRPDLVRQVIRRARERGPLDAWRTARSRLEEPLTPGYSAAGVVEAVGRDVPGISAGDRVACAGAGYAVHAERIAVPGKLVRAVPEGVSLEAAAFTTVGSIALHGFRLAGVEVGARVAVIGLGLVGQLAAQIVRAAGCRAIGLDLEPERVELARRLGLDRGLVSGGEDGVEAVREAVEDATDGLGADAVLVCAATRSSGPVRQAGRLCRDRGTVVVVGAVGMEVPRDLYYGKELTLRVARSYGPGRYDPSYEEEGTDYPPGYVRWTENRNMGAFLELLRAGEVDVDPLVTHRFDISRADGAYDLIAHPEEGRSALAVLIEYPGEPGDEAPAGPASAIPAPGEVQTTENPTRPDDLPVGLLGAGDFATGTLVPAMTGDRATRLVSVCAATGPSADHAARKFGFDRRSTDEEALASDPDVGAVAIATPHHLHARQAVSALAAGKHVYCEKPLCLTEAELASVVRATLASEEGEGGGPVLTVGYNRRFAPMARELRDFFHGAGGPVAPLFIQYRVNAGRIPLDSWIQDPEAGGGRVIGEACHFVDFLSYLTDALPVRVSASGLPDRGTYREDNVAVNVEMSDGSVGAVSYVAAGDPALGKERCEAFGGGRSAALEDFRRLELVGEGRTSTDRSWLGQDKGHEDSWAAFSRAAREGAPAPIALESLVATSLATFRILESLRSSGPKRVEAREFIERIDGEDR